MSDLPYIKIGKYVRLRIGRCARSSRNNAGQRDSLPASRYNRHKATEPMKRDPL
jgi:hypothetical protein